MMMVVVVAPGCDDAPNETDTGADTAVVDVVGTADSVTEITDDTNVSPDGQDSGEDVEDSSDVTNAGPDDVPGGDITSDAVDATDAEVVQPQVYNLTTNPAWAEVLLDADPYYTANDPSPDICPDEDWKVEITPEGQLMEINTSFCAWLTLAQPLLEDVPVGATLRLEVRHAEILDGDTDYKLAVTVGELPIWAESVEVFELANVFEFSVVATEAMTAGETVYFHLENHGANTWNFVSFTAEY